MPIRDIKEVAVFAAVDCAAGATITSSEITLSNDEYFALRGSLTGTGTGKFNLETSDDGSTWEVPDTGDEIMTAVVDGTPRRAAVRPPVCKRVRIKFTETGGVNPVVVTAALLIK